MIVRCYSKFINLNAESVPGTYQAKCIHKTIRKFLRLFSELFSPYFVFNPLVEMAFSVQATANKNLSF